MERRYRRISCASPGCLKLSEQKKHSFTPRARVTAFTGTAVIPFICINILHDSDSRTPQYCHHRACRSWQNHPGRSNAPPVWCIPGESNGRRARDGFQCPGKERGITILAKNCAIEYLGTHINIVDTPGHADFGGEVERVLSMVDSVLLLVDAVEGPMPQTRFVTKKALAQGLQSIVVVNKIDRPGARADWVINQTFDLFDKLGASEQQLDFPVIYASGLHGYAGHDARVRTGTLQPLFEAILQYVPVRTADPNGPLQLQIAALDYSSYVGRIGIGRISRGALNKGQTVALRFGPGGDVLPRKINQIHQFKGLERVEVERAQAGDIVLVNGIEEIGIGATLCDLSNPEALPMIAIDEPTLTMKFCVNTSPLAGREGKFVTSRQLRERLMRELNHNVALRVKDTEDETVFEVSGRGELHLTILIENMRREGYELAVSRPRVVMREINGIQHEPFELLTVDSEDAHQGGVMEEIGRRKGELLDMASDAQGRIRLEYRIAARGLIGLQSVFMTLTRGTGLMSHIFDAYAPVAANSGGIGARCNGALISQDDGAAVAYALWKLQERGRMVVNPVREKKLTNIRAAGKDEHIDLVPPVPLSLEYAAEFVDDDELVEVTPQSIRLRKRFLKEHERRRAQRSV